MGVPPVIIHFNGFFPHKPSIFGYPQFRKPFISIYIYTYMCVYIYIYINVLQYIISIFIELLSDIVDILKSFPMFSDNYLPIWIYIYNIGVFPMLFPCLY